MATTEKKPTVVHTKMVRLMYLHIWEPYAQEEGQKKKFSATILIPKKDKETIKAINKAIAAARAAGKEKLGKIIESKFKLPLRDGDEERDEDPNFANCYFLTASSDIRPGVIDIDREDIVDKSDLYSGCYGRVSLNFYPFAVTGNKGIAVGLNNIQKLKDGKRFDGRISAQDDFKDDWELDDEDDDDDIDEAPVKKAKKKPVVEDDDDDDDEDIVARKKAAAKKKKLAANDDYDDDEDDEVPVKKAKKKKRPVDDDDDEEF